MTEVLYSTKEVAEKLGLSERGVRKLAAQLQIGKHAGTGRRGVWVFNRKDITKLENRHDTAYGVDNTEDRAYVRKQVEG